MTTGNPIQRLTFHPFTPERLADLERFSAAHGKVRYCSCMRGRPTSTAFTRATRDEGGAGRRTGGAGATRCADRCAGLPRQRAGWLVHGRAARVVPRHMGSPETFRRAGLVEAGRSVAGRPNVRWEVDTVPARG